ncbi:MAG: GxxExxY protein [Chloroflexi bacterium]|nr:GxxExxY protein [Chloroflexota bacterium]
MTEKERLNGTTESIIGAAIKAHRALGPGLLESAYQACTAFELVESGHKVEIQKELPIVYRGVRLDCGYRLDFARRAHRAGDARDGAYCWQAIIHRGERRARRELH